MRSHARRERKEVLGEQEEEGERLQRRRIKIRRPEETSDWCCLWPVDGNEAAQ